jgi:hypothetical protein
MSELNAAAAVEPSKSPAPAAPAPAASSPTVTTTAPVPAATPVTSQALTASQKVGLERLAELTELYKAGKITPYEYHTERARVIESMK